MPAREQARDDRLPEERQARHAPLRRRRRSGRQEPGARRGELLRPHHDPLAVLHLLHLEEIVAVVVGAVEAQLADDRVDAVLRAATAPSALSSRLLVAVTAASSTCQAANEPAACVSTYGYGTLALVARSRKSGTSFAAPGLFMNGGCSSKTVEDSASLPSGATRQRARRREEVEVARRRVVELLHRLQQLVAVEPERADPEEVGLGVLHARGQRAPVARAELVLEVEHAP